MKRNLWIAVAILWLTLPFVALRYWLVWNRLPERIATHFNAAGQPNGWMSPSGSLEFVLMLLGLMAVTAALIVRFLRRADITAWAALGLFHLVAGVILWGNEQVLGYNLYGQPVHIVPMVVFAFVGVAVCTFFFLGAGRGAKIFHTDEVAEEVHAVRAWAVLFAVPLVIEAAVAVAIPQAGVRLVLGLGALVLLGATALAWDGFHYFFSRAGVEVRTLGLRLRSIPAGQISEYAAAPWSWLGGYGIRGIGHRRAYVWGNHGVRIRTRDGDEIFLGHSQPERIVHDLDVVKTSAG